MAVFKFKALNPQGSQVEGQQVAEDRKAAFEKIRARGLHPVTISQVERRRIRLGNRKPTRKHMLRVVRQMATLLNAGVPLLETIENLKRGEEAGEMSQRFTTLLQQLRQGQRLADSLRSNFSELPDYVFSLVALGETTGQLAKTLSDAADRMDTDEALSAELRSALSYPMVLAGVGGVIVFAMFLFVIPRFGALVDRSGADIPAFSRLVIDSGIWLRANWFLFLAGVGGLLFGLQAVVRSNAQNIRRIAMRVPGVGGVMRKVDFENWSRTLGVALANGAQLLPALDLAGQTVKSKTFSSQLEGVRRDVRTGVHLDEAFLSNVPYCDAMLVDLMATGRKSGTLDQMLILAADSYRAEVGTLTKRLTAIAEPVAILLISTVVGALVVSIVLAMTSLYDFDI
jgi:type II secretory pathway component PulF